MYMYYIDIVVFFLPRILSLRRRHILNGDVVTNFLSIYVVRLHSDLDMTDIPKIGSNLKIGNHCTLIVKNALVTTHQSL